MDRRVRHPRDAVEIEHVSLSVEMTDAAGGFFSTFQNPAARGSMELILLGGQVRLLAGGKDATLGLSSHGGRSIDCTFATRAFPGRDGDVGSGARTAEFFHHEFPGGPSGEIGNRESDDVSPTFRGADAIEDDVHVHADAVVELMRGDPNAAHGRSAGPKATVSGHGGTIRDGAGRDVLNASLNPRR